MEAIHSIGFLKITTLWKHQMTSESRSDTELGCRHTGESVDTNMFEDRMCDLLHRLKKQRHFGPRDGIQSIGVFEDYDPLVTPNDLKP